MKENLAQMKIQLQEMKNIGEYFKICFCQKSLLAKNLPSGD